MSKINIIEESGNKIIDIHKSDNIDKTSNIPLSSTELSNLKSQGLALNSDLGNVPQGTNVEAQITQLNTDLTKLTDGKEVRFVSFNFAATEQVTANTWSFTSFQLPAPPEGYTYADIFNIHVFTTDLPWARIVANKTGNISLPYVAVAIYALGTSTSYNLSVRVIYAK